VTRITVAAGTVGLRHRELLAPAERHYRRAGGYHRVMRPDDAAGLADMAIRMLRANPYGFLVTAVGEGPHSRLVQHLCVEDDATIWVGTSPRSRKVADIAVSALVCYSVEDRAAFAYLTIAANAAVIEDAGQRRAKWDSGLAPFFPGGPEGDDFVLLRLAAMRIELMNFARRVHPDPYGLVPAVIQRRAGS
jgi:general stress protein 26